MIDNDVSRGIDVVIIQPVNLYGCSIMDHVRIGPYVEIQSNVIIGSNVKIGSHTFICSNTIIEAECFIGHGVNFCNDRYPRSTIDGRLKGRDDWVCSHQRVEKGASIGTGSTIMAGVKIGMHAMVGAGSVVTKNVKDYEIVAGNPAKVIGMVKEWKNSSVKMQLIESK